METASVQSMKMHLAAAKALGLNPAPFFEAAGLSPDELLNPENRVPLAQAAIFIEHLASQAPVPSYGLWLGEQFHPAQLGITGYLLMNAETLAVALTTFCHYQQINGDAFVWRLEPGSEMTTLIMEQNRLARLGPIATEWSALSILQSARILSGMPISPVGVTFAHGAPPWADHCANRFNCPVAYNAPGCTLLLHTADLQLPIHHADSALGNQFRQIADNLLSKIATDTPMSRKVLAHLLPWQPGQEPTLASVAKHISVSGRSLQAALSKEKTSFRELLAKVRLELATAHLKDDRLTIADVSFLLGFSEPSAFHRAFRNWTGTTPARFREIE